MKKFVYQVGNYEFADTEAFGKAWKDAKAKAAKMHTAIYRLVIKGENVRQEVLYKGGVFNSVEFIRENNIEIF